MDRVDVEVGNLTFLFDKDVLSFTCTFECILPKCAMELYPQFD